MRKFLAPLHPDHPDYALAVMDLLTGVVLGGWLFWLAVTA